MVVLLLDLPCRVFDLFRQRREIGATQVVHDALHDRDDHEGDDLHRLVEGELIREPVEGVVVQHDDTVRLGPEGIEALARDVRAALHTSPPAPPTPTTEIFGSTASSNRLLMTSST